MHFLPDVYVPCDVCHGKRYNRETLEVRYKGQNIHEVLEMTVEEALEFFCRAGHRAQAADAARCRPRLRPLGQSATTLSGGEAQRVKLSQELAKRDTGRTLYILDEPTTGLALPRHRAAAERAARLREHGNTVVVIEHNLDVIKTADWIIDLGPEGGGGGGRIVAPGTPEESHVPRRATPAATCARCSTLLARRTAMRARSAVPAFASGAGSPQGVGRSDQLKMRVRDGKCGSEMYFQLENAGSRDAAGKSGSEMYFRRNAGQRCISMYPGKTCIPGIS